MDMDVWEQMPDDLKQVHRCYFRDNWQTEYIITSVESDTSQLEYVVNKGTCFNPALPHEFEAQVWEVDSIPDKPGHYVCHGISGQFRNANQLAGYYGVSLDEIMSNKLTGDIGVHSPE